MRLLLNTNALICSISTPEELGTRARLAITEGENEVFVSVVSLWEMLVKLRAGKLNLPLAEVEQVLEEEGSTRLAIHSGHLRALEALPIRHKDPFDHLLIAQAIGEDMIFVTRDAEADKYPVRVMPC